MYSCKYCKQALDNVFTTDLKQITVCGYYSNVKRKDGKHWAHYPECKSCNCPLIHPELLEGEEPIKEMKNNDR